MSKSVRKLVLLAGLAVLVGACSSPRYEPYDDDFWSNNLSDHWKVIKRDAKAFYKTFDSHFFDYDWDEPIED